MKLVFLLYRSLLNDKLKKSALTGNSLKLINGNILKAKFAIKTNFKIQLFCTWNYH